MRPPYTCTTARRKERQALPRLQTVGLSWVGIIFSVFCIHPAQCLQSVQLRQKHNKNRKCHQYNLALQLTSLSSTGQPWMMISPYSEEVLDSAKRHDQNEYNQPTVAHSALRKNSAFLPEQKLPIGVPFMKSEIHGTGAV